MPLDPNDNLPEQEPATTEDRTLLAWPALRLSSLVRRVAAQRFRRMFDLSMLEWIIVVHLAADTPVSLSALARNAGLDPQRTSVAVSRLAKRALLDRVKNPHNAREVQVSLTARGRAVFNAIIENWLNKELCAGLSEAEIAAAGVMLNRLAGKAEQMLQREIKGEN